MRPALDIKAVFGLRPLTLGERVRCLRRQRGISQETLASLVGCTRNTINRLEGDRTDVHSSTMLQIARVLQYPLAELSGEAYGTAMDDRY